MQGFIKFKFWAGILPAPGQPRRLFTLRLNAYSLKILGHAVPDCGLLLSPGVVYMPQSRPRMAIAQPPTRISIYSLGKRV